MDTVAYIGLDWGDARHSVHLQTPEGTIEHLELDVLHGPISRPQMYRVPRVAPIQPDVRHDVVHVAKPPFRCYNALGVGPAQAL